MTIDEAIEHAEEVEKENRKLSKRYDDASGYSRSGNKDIRTNDAKKCEKCAEEHRQLADWLKDYKRLLEQESQTEWIPIEKKLPDMGIEVLVSDECHNISKAIFKGYKDSTYWISEVEVTENHPIWQYEMGSISSEHPEAWMPLPKEYKKSETRITERENQ